MPCAIVWCRSSANPILSIHDVGAGGLSNALPELVHGGGAGGTAQLVGASRETVNKALADFAARGWLQISARSVLILDKERLRRRAR